MNSTITLSSEQFGSGLYTAAQLGEAGKPVSTAVVHDAAGSVVDPTALTALYDINGNYAGSYGSDPSTGYFAAWDSQGNETSLQGLITAHNLAANSQPVGADVQNGSLILRGDGAGLVYNEQGKPISINVAGYTNAVANGTSSYSSTSGLTQVRDTAGQLLGTFGAFDDNKMGVWDSTGSYIDATSILQANGFTTAQIQSAAQDLFGTSQPSPNADDAAMKDALTRYLLTQNGAQPASYAIDATDSTYAAASSPTLLPTVLDSGGNALTAGEDIVALYDSSGAYVASYGLDKTSGYFSTWDAAGNETSLANVVAGLSPGESIVDSNGTSGLLFDANGHIVGTNVAGFTDSVASDGVPAESIVGLTRVLNSSGDLAGSFGSNNDGVFEVWDAAGNGLVATPLLQSLGFSATTIARGATAYNTQNSSAEDAADAQAIARALTQHLLDQGQSSSEITQSALTSVAQNFAASTTSPDLQEAARSLQLVLDRVANGTATDEQVKIFNGLASIVGSVASQGNSSIVPATLLSGALLSSTGFRADESAQSFLSVGVGLELFNIAGSTASLGDLTAGLSSATDPLSTVGDLASLGSVQASADLVAGYSAASDGYIATSEALVQRAGGSLSNISTAVNVQLEKYDARQLNDASFIQSQTDAQLLAIRSAQLSIMGPLEIAGLSAHQMSILTASQLSSFMPQQVRAFSGAQIGALSAQQIGAVDISLFSADQISHIAIGAVSGISAWSLSRMSAAQAGALSVGQIGNLTSQQEAAFNGSAWGAVATTYGTSIGYGAPIDGGGGPLVRPLPIHPPGMPPVGVAPPSPATKTAIAADFSDLGNLRSFSSDGTLAVGITQDPDTGDNQAYFWNGSSWYQLAGSWNKVAIATDGSLWGLAQDGSVSHYVGNEWVDAGANADDIATGTDGSVYVASSVTTSGTNVLQWNGTGWTAQTGIVSQLAVGSDGSLWGIGSTSAVIHHTTGSGWTDTGLSASGIAAGGNGYVFALSDASNSAGGDVSSWNGSSWTADAQQLAAVAIDGSGAVFGIDANQSLLQRASDGTWTTPGGPIGTYSYYGSSNASEAFSAQQAWAGLSAAASSLSAGSPSAATAGALLTGTLGRIAAGTASNDEITIFNGIANTLAHGSAEGSTLSKPGDSLTTSGANTVATLVGALLLGSGNLADPRALPFLSVGAALQIFKANGLTSFDALLTAFGAGQDGAISHGTLAAISSVSLAAQSGSAFAGAANAIAQLSGTLWGIGNGTNLAIAQIDQNDGSGTAGDSSISSLDDQAIQNLSASQLATLSLDQVSALTSHQMSVLSAAQMEAFLPDQISAMSVTQITAVSTNVISGLSASFFNAMGPDQVLDLSSSQVAAINKDQVAGIETSFVGNLSATQIQSLTTDQIGAFGAYQINSLTASQAFALSADQIGAIDPGQMTIVQSATSGASVIPSLSGGGPWWDPRTWPHVPIINPAPPDPTVPINGPIYPAGTSLKTMEDILNGTGLTVDLDAHEVFIDSLDTNQIHVWINISSFVDGVLKQMTLSFEPLNSAQARYGGNTQLVAELNADLQPSADPHGALITIPLPLAHPAKYKTVKEFATQLVGYFRRYNNNERYYGTPAYYVPHEFNSNSPIGTMLTMAGYNINGLALTKKTGGTLSLDGLNGWAPGFHSIMPPSDFTDSIGLNSVPIDTTNPVRALLASSYVRDLVLTNKTLAHALDSISPDLQALAGLSSALASFQQGGVLNIVSGGLDLVPVAMDLGLIRRDIQTLNALGYGVGAFDALEDAITGFQQGGITGAIETGTSAEAFMLDANAFLRTLGGFSHFLVASPYILPIAIVAGLMTLVFGGNHDDPALMPDKYDTTRFTQYVGELQGSAGTAYGPAYNPVADPIQDTLGGLSELPFIQQWVKGNINSTNAEIRQLAQQLLPVYGDSDTGATGKLQFQTSLTYESVVGGTESGTYKSIHDDAGEVVGEIALLDAMNTDAFVPSLQAPAADYGNLDWTAFTLPSGSVGYWADKGDGTYYYYGPDNVLYDDSYPGQVHSSDVSSDAVGNVSTYDFTAGGNQGGSGGGGGGGGVGGPGDGGGDYYGYDPTYYAY